MSDAPLLNRLDQILDQLHQYDRQLADPAIAADHTQITKISQKRAAILPLTTLYQQYKDLTTEAADLKTILDTESDPELLELARAEHPQLTRQAADLLEDIKGELVTSDDKAVNSVILELRAGVGGDEAAIFANDLLQMYQRYAAAQNWKWNPMEFHASDMGGCKSAVINIKGENVWQHLGYEGGTHCVKRVPQTESQGRIHTSTATVAVLPEPQQVDIEIKDEDVKVDITTSQGPGGQNVNKVATAVKLLHIPTGIEVRMQDTKSQHQNRQLAWQLLRARLYEHHQKQVNAERAEQRSTMIGTGERGERIRTYRFKDNLAVDHRLNQSFNLQEILTGSLSPLITALIEQDKTQRLANI